MGGAGVVSRRRGWRGELGWVRISDNVKTGLTDESVALAACSEFAALDTRRAAEVMGCPGTAGSGCSANSGWRRLPRGTAERPRASWAWQEQDPVPRTTRQRSGPTWSRPAKPGRGTQRPYRAG